MRISDWSSDVCSSDLPGAVDARRLVIVKAIVNAARLKPVARLLDRVAVLDPVHGDRHSAVLTYAPMPLERRAHSAQRPAGGQGTGKAGFRVGGRLTSYTGGPCSVPHARPSAAGNHSDRRRVGQEGVSTFNSRGSAYQ